MLSKKLDSKDLKKANRIISSLDRLKRLYSHLSYNIKKEILPIQKEEINLKEFIEDRVAFFKEFNRNRFLIEVKPLLLLTDKIGLEQTIDNIIENAMKYSNKDSLISIYTDNKKLIIQDRGKGIEQSELSLIYQRYYQEDSTNLGEGIGLSIVKSFCDSNLINLKIESSKGVGTKVILDFKNIIIDENLQQT
jgi:signal transduction histidine kinase